MEPSTAIDLGRDAIAMALTIGAPVLLVGVLVGLVVGLIQAVTQIQDQTVSFVPKILAMVAVLFFMLPWMMHTMVEYSQHLISTIPQRLFGG